ncbi:MAG: 50S ribosomal protein L17 [Thermoanaerobacteraceae bacterium]|uniref:50S ribosomal protein L17 n=1 Tax=Thermanaeromonas sp. C210 TaxID=2731925 RepID=UPI00155D1906|nr:50S ribosomal protein L17 [Thermanaeromonas sp. C210]MBE3580324.1 50S ribosomal protein L17 [Thermoanaerobacteraceae bacterium]GFN23018.1 50S ribosomal protein L17 [Thermanaeromonas sp. C210]
MGYRKLGRRSDHRNMLLRNIVTSFLREGRLQTTEPRGKEIKRIADKMITLAKRGDLHARRQALAYLLDEDVVTKLFKEIGPRYADRQGGYTRLVKVGYRRGDGAPLVLVELV